MDSREYSFDGLVGPSHNYAGLARGNLASTRHSGWVSNPKAAALQGLDKMRHHLALGLGQGLLPPHPRPDVTTLRRMGFDGDDAQVLRRAAREAPRLLAQCSSASAMWTANAATVFPSADTRDGRLHLIPANLSASFHRQLESPVTERILRRCFGDSARFVVHTPLPTSEEFGDEGAANHSRLACGSKVVHLLAWGRSITSPSGAPGVHPARQTLEASAAVSRLSHANSTLLWQQSPVGIDAGGFHSDVLCVGNEHVLLLHEHAFVEPDALLAELQRRLGPGFRHCVASQAELPLADAVATYPFNSQLVTTPDGSMRIIAPAESASNPAARAYLDRVVAEDNPIVAVDYLDVRQSMSNGGGPACLRLRIQLTEAERRALCGRLLLDEHLLELLVAWVDRHYRDRLTADDLADPALLNESRYALDELSQLLDLGSCYDFQS